MGELVQKGVREVFGEKAEDEGGAVGACDSPPEVQDELDPAVLAAMVAPFSARARAVLGTALSSWPSHPERRATPTEEPPSLVRDVVSGSAPSSRIVS